MCNVVRWMFPGTGRCVRCVGYIRRGGIRSLEGMEVSLFGSAGKARSHRPEGKIHLYYYFNVCGSLEEHDARMIKP